MQWTFTCILLTSLAITSASNHGVRSKRDLSFIKSYLMSKIFGRYENLTSPVPSKTANYRLFRVPGFDSILVKAVPKVPVVVETDGPSPTVLEVTESDPVPVHPSIAIVSKYLGTEKLNDTLFALKGVKDLLQSGVLTAKRERFDQAAIINDFLPAVIPEAPKIAVDEVLRPLKVYPSLQKYRPEYVVRYPNLPIPSEYSYKQENKDGVMSYVAHDNQNVMVTESKRPVPFPSSVNYRIQDLILLGMHPLPTSPALHMKINSRPPPISVFEVPKIKMPYQAVKVMPSYIPSGYSYSQVHNDGSMTTYSGSGHVQEYEGDTPVVITEVKKPAMSVVVAEIGGHPAPIPVFNVPKVHLPPQPVRAPLPNSGYSYNQVHSDGSMTTYSGSGHTVKHEEVQPAFVVTEPGRPTVVVSDVEGPPAPFPVFNVPKVKVPSSSGYSYNQVHNDGTVTTYSGSGHVNHDGEKSAVVITEPGRPAVVVSDVEGPPAPFPVFNAPKVKVPSSSAYSYDHVHNDGTVTTYSGSGHVNHAGEKSAVVITEPGRPTVVVSDVEGAPAPFPIYNAPHVEIPSTSGFSYNQVHNDGTVTTYSGSGHVKHEGKKPAAVITELGRPTVVVSDVEGSPAPFPVYNAPHVKVPSDSGYSYNHVHNDGSMTTYSGSGHVKHEGEKSAVVITEPGRPTVVVSDVEGPPAPFPVFNVPKAKVPASSGFSYNHVHNDGSVTTYSGSGQVNHEEEKSAVLTELGQPTVVVSNAEGPPAPFPIYNAPHVKVPYNSGYSYNHVRNDGSVITYSGSGHVVGNEREKQAAVITKPGRPTIVVSDVEGPPAPFPLYNAPHVKVHSDSGYSYNQVRNDGSITTYSGSGHVAEYEEGKPAAVITESGRPTVEVADAGGPPAPFPIFNAPHVEMPSNSVYSYNHVRNDGSVTTYAGSGHIAELRGEKAAAVITELGRPTVVVADAKRPPTPLPNFSEPGIKIPSDSGYSYQHVHNDGSTTMYSGNHKGDTTSVVVTESRQPLQLPTFLTNRIENAVVTANSGRPPANFYRYPTPVYQEHHVIMEERPDYAYHVRHNSYEMPRPYFREQVKVHSVNHNDQSGPNKVPSGFSYETVHEDGSVSSYTGAGVKVAHAVPDRPILYPTGPADVYVKKNNKGKKHSLDTVNCKDPEHSHSGKKVLHSHNIVQANSNASTFSYTVSKDGSSTTYSGSGQVVQSETNNAAHVEAKPIVADPPLLVTQTDDDNPQKVSLTPVLTQYNNIINHHDPEKFGNGQSNAKVSLPAVSSNSDLQSVEVSKVSKEEPVVSSTKKAAETVSSTSRITHTVVSTSTKTSHSSKPKRVRHRVRTSTPSSSSKVLKTSAPFSTTPKASSTTVSTSLEGSLSANPIVVLPEENVFSFTQDRADGTSITVIGNKENTVSVVEEPKASPNRGDIPDSSY